MFLRRKHKHTPCLTDIYNRFCVVVIEQLFNGHRLRAVLFHQRGNSVIYLFKTDVKRHSRGGGNRSVFKHGEMVVSVFHNSAPDYGIARVDSENYHFLPVSLSLITMRVGVPSSPKTSLI